MLRWIPGRQESGYFKMKLFSFAKIDCYLIKYPPGSCIGKHKDSVGRGSHYRANLLVKDCGSGGKFLCQDTVMRLPRFVVFRPDINTHEVTKVVSGVRYILSVGWVTGSGVAMA